MLRQEIYYCVYEQIMGYAMKWVHGRKDGLNMLWVLLIFEGYLDSQELERG